jgi:hypothetical protein
MAEFRYNSKSQVNDTSPVRNEQEKSFYDNNNLR